MHHGEKAYFPSKSFFIMCIAAIALCLFLMPIHALAAGYSPLEFKNKTTDVVRPVACATDSSENYYICDAYYKQITILNSSSKQMGEIKDGFLMPVDVTVTDNAVFVLDETQNAVVIYDLNGEYVSTLGEHGLAPGQFDLPSDILIDSDELYVADRGNNRIQVFGVDDLSLHRIIGLESGGADLAEPTAIAIEGDTLYAVHHGGDTVVGIDKFSGSSTGLSRSLSAQSNIYITNTGSELIISDPSAQAIHRYDFSLNLIETIDTPSRVYRLDTNDGKLLACGSTWYTDDSVVYRFSSDYSTYTEFPIKADDSFDSPYAVTTDANGDIFITDHTNNRLQVFSDDLVHQFSITDNIDAPLDIAHNNGLIYVLNSDSTVQIFNTSGTLIESMDISFVSTPKRIDIIDATRMVILGGSGLYFINRDGSTLTYSQKTHALATSLRDICVSGTSVYYLCSLSGDILKYTQTGVLSDSITASELKTYPENASSLAVHSDGTIFIATSSPAKLYRYDDSFNYIGRYDLSSDITTPIHALYADSSGLYLTIPQENEIGLFTASSFSGSYAIKIDGDIVSGFSTDIYSYDYRVTSDREAIDIGCVVSGGYSADGAIGRYLLDYGLNKFKVMITKSGDTKSYLLYVTRAYPPGFSLDDDTIDAFIAYQATSEANIAEQETLHGAGANVLMTLDLKNIDTNMFDVISLSKHVTATLENGRITLQWNAEDIDETPTIQLTAKDGLIAFNEQAMTDMLAQRRNLYIALSALAGAIAIFTVYFFTMYLQNHPGKRKFPKFVFKTKK